MKRHPAFDPPEYRSWKPDERLVREYRSRIEGDSERAAVVAGLGTDGRLGIYRDLLVTRLQDTALKRWVRQGVISKAWLGTGEEAVTVGAVAALDRERDVVGPMIRNAGACHMMGLPLEDGFTCYLGTAASPSGGRDLHYGDIARGVIQPISHMGTSVTIAAGVALAFKKRGERRVALTWTGDGATRTAAFHEGMVFAARLRVPMIVVIQNNQVALGTALEQHGAANPGRMPEAYGLDAIECDGNNVLDVYAAAAIARERCLAGRGPATIVAETFRMGGHATHDEREARDSLAPELFEYWGRRDPVGMYECWLLEEGVARSRMARIEEDAERAVAEAADRALATRADLPAPESALFDGFSEGGPLCGLAHRLRDETGSRVLRHAGAG